ncbi:MAG: hypothetical protein JOZ54_02950, partial [Acidobacteria bacterium]|nr:hypothetical protein [Acidobacteriota bacterium]
MRQLEGETATAWSIRKIGSLGALQWSKRLDFSAVPNPATYGGPTISVELAPLAGGGVVCLFSGSPFILVALDDDGELLWQKQFTLPVISVPPGVTSQFATPLAIRRTSAGLLAIAGGYSASYDSGALVVTLSDAGDVIAAKVLMDFDYQEGSAAGAIDVREDGTIIIGGSKVHGPYFSGFRGAGALIAVIDPSGNVSWSRLYGPGLAYDVRATPSGYRAFVVPRPSNGVPHEGILLDLGPDGALLNQYHFGNTDTSSSWNTVFHLMSDGGWVQTGRAPELTPGFVATRISSTGEILYDEVIQGGSALSYDILPPRSASGSAVVIGTYSCGPTEGGLLCASVGNIGESCAPSVPHETPAGEILPVEVTDIPPTTTRPLVFTVDDAAVAVTDFPADAIDACAAVCTIECQNTAQPDVTVSRLNIDNAKVSVKYSFPSGSTNRRLLLRTPAWIDAQGRSYPEQTVHEWPAGDPALSGPGPYTATISVPLGSSRQIEILAEVRYTNPSGGCNARAFGYGAVDAQASANGVSLS